MNAAGASAPATLRRNETDAEYRLWYELSARRLNGFKFVRQFPIDRYVVDFACRSMRLVIELDGAQHAASVRDAARTEFLNDKGWSVLRFWNEEVSEGAGGGCETILAALWTYHRAVRRRRVG